MKIKLLLLLQLIILNSVYSQVGTLDSTFGTNGITITDVSNNLLDDGSSSVFVKDNNSILLTGYSTNTNGYRDFALAQYNSNGVLDNTFGTDGITILNISSSDSHAFASIIQSDGKIITVGYTNNTTSDVAVARFNSNGTLDMSYATNGIYSYDSGGDDTAVTVSILPDDKIIIGCNFSNDYGLLKLTNSGILDASFGTNGTVKTNLGGIDATRGMKLQSDGKILIVGTSSKKNNGDGDVYDKAVIRYNSDGSLDTSFNSTGIVFTSFESGKDDGGYAINIQSDGKIIVNGASENPQGYDNIALVRYNTDGSIDSSFGTNGTTFTNYADDDASFTSLIQKDGKIIIAGYSTNMTTFKRDFILVRYNNDGLLDNTFGTNGICTTDLNNNSSDFGFSLAFQSDNKILLAGYTEKSGGTYDSAIARYTIDGNLGIDDFENKSEKYSIFPNPFSESISVISHNSNNQKADIGIYSMDSKKIKSINNYVFDANQNIHLGHIAKGVYLLKISNQFTTEIIKIIKN